MRPSARPAETAEKPFAPPLENDNDWENGFSFGKSRFLLPARRFTESSDFVRFSTIN